MTELNGNSNRVVLIIQCSFKDAEKDTVEALSARGAKFYLPHASYNREVVARR